jgi:hypothetical protein
MMHGILNISQFMLLLAQVALCSEIHTKHIKCGQSVQLLNVEPVGTLRKKQATKC